MSQMPIIEGLTETKSDGGPRRAPAGGAIGGGAPLSLVGGGTTAGSARGGTTATAGTSSTIAGRVKALQRSMASRSSSGSIGFTR